MPDSIDQLELSQQVALLEADPELHSLLGNTATAELELAALNGSLPDVAATPQQRQEQSNAARVAELVAMAPAGRQGYYRELSNGEQEYVQPQQGNTTALMELMALDPIAAQREQLQATPLQQGGMNEEQVNFVNQEMARMRNESLNAAFSVGQV